MTGSHCWMWTKLLSHESTTAGQRCWKRWIARSLKLVDFIFYLQFLSAIISIEIFNFFRWLRRRKTSPDIHSGTSISWTTWRTICRSQNSTKMFPPNCIWWTMFTGTLHNQKSTIKLLIRSANYTPPGHYAKCFHNTEHVLTLHNHFPTRCLGKQLA